MDKCKGCICIQCAKEFGINPIECEISDCIWCRNEPYESGYNTCGKYLEKICGRYLEKIGTYGKKPI